MSSHDPVLASIIVESEKIVESSKYSQTYRDCNRKKVIWDKSKLTEYRQLTDRALLNACEYWNKPEAIPLLCNLLPRLLVQCSEMTMETKVAGGPGKKHLFSKRVNEYNQKLQRAFRKWKAAGRSYSKADTMRMKYLKAKAQYQNVRRYEDSLAVIRRNNSLMRANKYDRNRIYSRMRKSRGLKTATKPLRLETPIGSFTGVHTRGFRRRC